MAQIKKLQPGGTTPEKTTPKYGRLIQNGVEVQANDDVINWLAQQGYYGEQMANNLRSGDDQYLDTDEQGVGWIRNISVENPELKEKQQERTTRASRRLEGRRLNQARADIQRLATYDYSKFAETPKAKTPYKWETLVIDYNPKEDGTKVFSNNQVNFDIIRRLDDLKNGLVIPEDQEFKDYDRVTQHYNNVKDLLEGTISRMRAGKLTADDEDILEGFSILATAPKSSSDSTSSTPETENLEHVIKTQLGISDKELTSKMASEFTVGVNGRLVPKKALSDRFGNNYWFSEHDLDGYNKYAGYVLLNGELYSTKSNAFNNWLKDGTGKQFVNLYNQGLWQDASQYMGFKGSDRNWTIHNPQIHYAPFLLQGDIYRDVSQYYMYPEGSSYLGAIETLEDDFDEYGLRKRKVYHIDPSNAKLQLNLSSYDAIVSPDMNIPVLRWNNNELLVPTKVPNQFIKFVRNIDGSFGVYNVVDNDSYEIDLAKLIKAGLLQENQLRNIQAILNAVKKTGRRFASGGVLKYQPGGHLVPNTQETKTLVADIDTDPTKSLKNTEYKKFDWDQLSSHDRAELVSIGFDAASILTSLVPGYGNVAAAALGLGSTVSNFIANQRDGFQLSDLGFAALDLGLTGATLIPGAGTAGAVSKFVKGLGKAHRILSPIFITLGLVDGAQGLQNIISGEYDMQDIRSVANGVMAVRGAIGNKMSHKTAKKFADNVEPKKRTSAKVSNSVDARIKSIKENDPENYDKLVEKVVDRALELHPEWKSHKGTTNSWAENGKIDHKEAWKALREDNNLITDDIIISAMNWKDRTNVGVSKTIDNTKRALSSAGQTGLEWFKQASEWFVPVNPTNYSRVKPIGRRALLDANAYERAYINAMHLTSPEGRFLPKKAKYVDVYKKDVDGLIVRKKGGKIRKCQDGDDFDRWNDEINWENDNMGSMEEGEKEILGSLPKPKLFTVNPVKNSDLNIPSSNSTTPRKKGQGVAGIGEVKNWSSIGEGLIGNGARAAAYLTTHFTNKRVLDHALDAIRSKYLGAMKSMPIQQPLQRYNITPMTSLFDKQRTEFRNASRQIAKNFADSKLQVAQFLATEDQIAKREDNLLNQISKHITEVDLANTQSRNMHAKDEQAIADYNRNLGGQQKAEESMALAQYAQKQGDNFNKSNAEFRTDWNKYLASKDQINLYENYQDVFNKYRAETDPSKKAEYAEQIGLLSYLIKHGGSTRNPITYGRS